jgi:hypothetical protein
MQAYAYIATEKSLFLSAAAAKLRGAPLQEQDSRIETRGSGQEEAAYKKGFSLSGPFDRPVYHGRIPLGRVD